MSERRYFTSLSSLLCLCGSFSSSLLKRGKTTEDTEDTERGEEERVGQFRHQPNNLHTPLSFPFLIPITAGLPPRDTSYARHLL